ncbi:MAG TPA: AsmA family protein [Alphaproteobacteria bacterium]|jgi:AsmA protein
MRWIKRLVVGTLSVILVLVALALIVPFLIPTSAYKDQIETRVKAATGRDLKLGGELKLSILPNLELSARDVVFGNRPGAAAKDMAKLKGLDLKLKLGPLLSGRFEIVALELVEPDIILEIDKDGKPNWQFDKPAGAPAAAPAKPGESAQKPAALPTDIFNTLQVESLRIVRGHVIFSDARSGARHELAKANLDISLPGGDRPFRIAGDVEYKGKRVAFKSEVKSPIVMMKGQPSDLAIDLDLELAKISLVGTAQTDPNKPAAARISGLLKIDVPSVRALAAWAGAPLAPGKAFGPLNLSATVTYAAEKVTLAGFAFKLDEIAASGELALALGDVPTLSGSISIPALNLTPYMAAGAAPAPAPPKPPAAPPPGTAQPARPGPAAPGAIDPAPLRALNADLKVDARQIQANQFRAAQATLGIKLAGGVLAVALDPVLLFGGSATGTITVNGARTPLTVNPNIQLKGLDGHAVLAAVGATDRLSGTLNATANLTGTGSDAKAIQNSLTGPASFQFANGALRGYNLAGMFRAIGSIKSPLEIIQQVKAAVEALNRFDPNQKTDFSELSASFRASNGVFNTSDLRMTAPLLRVEGRGTISVPASALDMHLAVKAVPTLRGQGAEFAKLGIPIPLRVHGPFANLSWGLDEKGFGDEIRKRAPELIKQQILEKPGDLLKKPGDILKKPGGILEQFRR